MSTPHTTKGKDYAIEQLKLRRKKNEGQEHIYDGSLRAGSPMHYYCIGCDELMTLPENHTCPVPTLCEECKALKKCGWLE